jgi:hypothetical protein
MRLEREEHEDQLAARVEAHEAYLRERSSSATAAAQRIAADQDAANSEREEAVATAETDANRRQEDLEREEARLADRTRRAEADSRGAADRRKALERQEMALETAVAANAAQRGRLDRREAAFNDRSARKSPAAISTASDGAALSPALSPFMPMLKGSAPSLAAASPPVPAASVVTPGSKRARDGASGRFDATFLGSRGAGGSSPRNGPGRAELASAGQSQADRAATVQSQADRAAATQSDVAAAAVATPATKRKRGDVDATNADAHTGLIAQAQPTPGSRHTAHKKRKSMGAHVFSALRSAFGMRAAEDELTSDEDDRAEYEDGNEDEDGGVEVMGKLVGAFDRAVGSTPGSQKSPGANPGRNASPDARLVPARKTRDEVSNPKP